MSSSTNKEGLTLSPKTLVGLVGALALAFGGGYVAPKGGEAQAGGVPQTSTAAEMVVPAAEWGAVKQKVLTLEKDRDADRAAWREDVKGMNLKLDAIASRLPAVRP